MNDQCVRSEEPNISRHILVGLWSIHVTCFILLTLYLPGDLGLGMPRDAKPCRANTLCDAQDAELGDGTDVDTGGKCAEIGSSQISSR